MDLLSTFAVGATLWTAGNVIKFKHRPSEEELILIFSY